MSPDPVTLARVVANTHVEREWRRLDGTYLGGTVCDSCRRPWPCKFLPLARAVIAVSELHRPIRVYDDCGDPECLNDHVWIADTVACEDSAIGWACARCCYYGEHPLECADHHGDHKGVPQVRACATRAALNGEIDD